MNKKFSELPRIISPNKPGHELHVVQVCADKSGKAVVSACWTVDEFKEWINEQPKTKRK